MTASRLDEAHLAALIEAGESDLLEFKREWWDLDSGATKGRFVRDILAMANALGPGEIGFIVVGIEDHRAGGAVVGVSESPTQEAVAQILDIYTNPVPRIRLHDVALKGKRLSVIEVAWSDGHPHYATRDVDTILLS